MPQEGPGTSSHIPTPPHAPGLDRKDLPLHQCPDGGRLNRHFRAFFGNKNHGVLRRILMEINTNLSKPQQSSPTPDP